MKHFFLAASLAAAVTGAGAQVSKTPVAAPLVPYPARIVANESILPLGNDKSDGESQALTYRTLYTPSPGSSSFSFFPAAVNDNVMHYDMKSGTIFVVRNDATFDQQSGALQTGSLSIMVSSNKGQTWTQRNLLQNVNYYIGMPQLAIVAPDGASSIDDYYYLVYGPKYLSGTGTPTVGTAIIQTPGNEAYDLEFNLTGTLNGYRFFNGADIVADPSTLVVHQPAMLTNQQGVTRQYGAYGVSSLSLGDEDWRQLGQPSVFALDKYRPSDGGINSSFNAPIYVDTDGEGVAYIATNNFLAGADNRLIQVHKSDDEGVTWSEPNEMPQTILTEYATSIGANLIFQPGQTPYRGGEFVVTGPDEYSYFTRVLAGTASAANPSELESILSYAILECKYKNNAWSISKVAELNIFDPFMFTYQDSLSSPQVNNELTFARSENGRGHEIQVARSGDGKLIVKYIDIDTNRRITWSPSYRLMTQQSGLWIEDGRIDTLFSTDVFIGVRDLNGSTWSTPINVTNDNEYNIRTYIPRDVASTNEIPFLQAPGGLINNLNPQFSQAIVNLSGAAPRFAMINMSTVSVEEDPANSAFHVADVRPNPATNNAEVVFTLDRPATVSVDVYDVMGNLVSTVVPATRMDAAVNGTNINVSNFAPGTYMVAVTVDGVRTARKFTVVK